MLSQPLWVGGAIPSPTARPAAPCHFKRCLKAPCHATWPLESSLPAIIVSYCTPSIGQSCRQKFELMSVETPAHALECKAWWADRILQGKKTIEVRQYPLPQQLLGTPVWLAASTGLDGQAVLGDCVTAGQPGAELVGWVSFVGVEEYSSAAEFQADEQRHCVTSDSVYAWKEGQTQRLYGWLVGSYHALDRPVPLPRMERLHRSLYKVVEEEGAGTA